MSGYLELQLYEGRLSRQIYYQIMGSLHVWELEDSSPPVNRHAVNQEIHAQRQSGKHSNGGPHLLTTDFQLSAMSQVSG